jgi:hypothetical protein
VRDFGPLAAVAAGLYGITQTVLVLVMINKFKAKGAKAAAPPQAMASVAPVWVVCQKLD